MAVRIAVSLGIALVCFILSFIVFNFAYMVWAVWRYPQANSMAGLTAFMYAIPVGGIFAILSFAVAFYWIGRRTSM
jgi:hypothetical protein